MKPQPITTYNPSFGIYKYTKTTSYGKCIYGKYKNYNIEIYHDEKDNAKLYYVSDSIRKWIKSKLVYFDKGIKKIIRSNNNSL